MASVKVKGIILKRIDFGEADRVITVFSEELGKISVIAKGVRRITSRRAGNVELLNFVSLGLYKKRGFTLVEAKSLRDFAGIKSNLNTSFAGFYVAELLERLVAEEQRHSGVLDLVLIALDALEANPRQIIIRAFEVKLLVNLGFWSLDRFAGVDNETLILLDKLERARFSEISQISLEEGQGRALSVLMSQYIESLIEGKLKSSEVLKKLKG